MKKRVADIVFDILKENGIDTCFCVVGGGAMHLNNALLKSGMRTVFNHHEQACSMAAEGYARYSGKMAAVCVTSGPGGTNALNGVQGAWADSIPMIVISGFPRWETSALLTGLNIRTRGVQENDIISMVEGITKYAKRILYPNEIKKEMQHAIDIAMEGRRGPVWIDIPLNVQGTWIDVDELLCESKNEKFFDLNSDINYFMEELNKAERPCILTGSGIRSGNCIEEFRDFLSRFDMPIVGGFQLSDICYKGQKNFYGISGSIGSRGANFILQNADFILVLGNSLSYDQTGYYQEGFASHAKIFMVDAQKDEARKDGLNIEHLIHSDLSTFFDHIKSERFLLSNNAWREYCIKVSSKFSADEILNREICNLSDDSAVPNMLFWRKIFNKSASDAVFSLGNSGCVCGGLFCEISKPEQRVLVNYKCGSMGHDLPNAIGAATACGREVYCITGDGSFMMNIQELQTIREYNLPIKIILFSNDGYNAIRNTCKRFFDGEYGGCDSNTGVSFPNFSKIADSFEMKYKKCINISELDDSIDWIIKEKDRCILEINQMRDEINPPYVASIMDKNGRFTTPPLHIMSPLLDDDELKQWMISEE